MIIKVEPAPKVSDYPELVATIERYMTERSMTPGKKKRGRPKKAKTTMHPDLEVGMPSLLLDRECDLDLFQDVFFEASEGNRTSLWARFDEWQEEDEQKKRAAAQERDLKIKQANLEYENFLAEVIQPSEAQLHQMKHLARAVVDKLPKEKLAEKLAEFFRQVAKQKAKGGNWRKEVQITMDRRYPKLSFYGALSEFIKDEYGRKYSVTTVRTYVQREFKKLQQE